MREADKQITKLRCRDDGEKIRLTWAWPGGVEFVYVFEGGTSRLYTLPEYKKRGGFFAAKKPGVSTYYICLDNLPCKKNCVSFTVRATITYTLTEKHGFPVLPQSHKNYELTLTAAHFTPPETLCYTKKENNFPQHASDGIMYLFGEPLEAGIPLTRIIRTEKNEYIRLFVTGENSEIYSLRG